MKHKVLSMVRGITLLVELVNIGPHENLSLKLNADHSIIYAKNASGKSFIAKSLSAFNDLQNAEFIKGLVSIGCTNAKICVDNVAVNISNSGTAIALGKLAYPIYVFNEKYIDENLKISGYLPNGSIEGIILGKSNIDFQSEKYKLLGIKTAGIEIKEKITNIIEQRKKELRKYDVSTSTSDYKALTFDNIEKLSAGSIGYNADFDRAVEEYLSIKNSCEVNVNIPSLRFTVSVDINAIDTILKTSYTRSSFTDEFKTLISEKKDFIQKGLAISDGKACPFCGQQYTESALSLIDNYNKYLNDRESMVKSQLNSIMQQLENLLLDITDLYENQYPDIFDRTTIACMALSKSKRISLQSLPDKYGLINCINSIKTIVKEKSESIDCDSFDIYDIIIAFNTMTEELTESVKRINFQISSVNTAANNMSKEALRLKKEICQALQKELCYQLKGDFAELDRLRKEYRELLAEVNQKEADAKILKKSLVADTFYQLVQFFFDGKYSFNKDTFSLEFKNTQLNSSAVNVLSDGEKTIIALMFFIANIHSAVNSVDDYSRMLLVIDDPTTGLDAENISKAADIICDINSIVNTNEDIKTLILTHDAIFKSEIIDRQGTQIQEIVI